MITGLSPLAHATPPDPVWIAGIYDDADYDNVVWILINADMTSPSARPAMGGRLLSLRDAPVPPAISVSASLAACPGQPRAPPAP